MASSSRIRGQAIHVRTRAVLSATLLYASWMFTLMLWIGKWLTYGLWPDKNKEWIATGISVALFMYHFLWGQRDLRDFRAAHGPHDRRRGIALTVHQAILIVLVIIGFSVFATWFCSW